MNARILIVEDYADVRTLIALILAAEGHEPIEADGREAVRCVHEVEPDLVVLDLNMRGMDGWETAARIRELSDVPVLFLTAVMEDEDRRHSVRVGAAGLMLKPFLRRELVEAVAAILSTASFAPAPLALRRAAG
jgi:two-component system, OmpR family, alkaline phosphatase synthesis response regulator PhoP